LQSKSKISNRSRKVLRFIIKTTSTFLKAIILHFQKKMLDQTHI
jgi:hypothetical protein